MSNNDYISDEERAYFRQEMFDVKPLKNNISKKNETQEIKQEPETEIEIETSQSFTIKPFRIRSHQIEEAPAPRIHHKTVLGEDILSYYQDGIQHRLRKQFRQGKLPIEATLDLHSHTAEEAITATHRFLLQSRENGCRVICIIHGKGKNSSEPPVIKNVLYHYLRNQMNILAFHSAQPKDGGTGALYLLLKRP